MNPSLHSQTCNLVFLGVASENYADVHIETCTQCGTKWIRYFYEYEAFSRSGRWFTGLIDDHDLKNMTPDNAAAFLEKLPWYFCGGSYFNSTGMRSSGKL